MRSKKCNALKHIIIMDPVQTCCQHHSHLKHLLHVILTLLNTNCPIAFFCVASHNKMVESKHVTYQEQVKSSESSNTFSDFCNSSLQSGSQPAGMPLRLHAVERHSVEVEPPLAVQNLLYQHLNFASTHEHFQ